MIKNEESPGLLNVLCLEEDLKDAEHLKKNLIDNGYLVTMVIATSQQEFADFLKSGDYDIILADNSLPQFDALAALKMTLSLKPGIPFICVSRTIGEEKAIELLKQGASDCVIIDRPERLFLAVKRALKENELEKERKHNEKLLKESEERFQLLFDKAPLGYQSLDNGGNFIEVNQQWLETLGYKKDEVVGKWFGDFLVPEFQDAFRERFPIFKAEGKVHTEFEMLHKNGSVLVIDFIGRIGYDTNRDFKQTHCILQDITEVKKSQEELIRQKELLKKSQLLLKSSIDSQQETIIFSIDTNYNYLIFNKAHSDAMKYAWNFDININMNILDCITTDEERVLAKRNYDRALNGESFSTIEQYGDVHPAYYESFFNPIRDGKNEIIGCTGLARNITQRKLDEEELKSAKEKAEESDRLKSAFLSNMSHEIRTPMNGILGFAELLKEPTLTVEEQQDFIKTIGISGERMLSTINSIVDISKIEAGMVFVNIEETNINDKLLFTHKFFNPEVESKGLKLFYKCSLPKNEAFIKTDNEKVYAILTNLVKNAIKFTHKGSIEFGYEKKGEYLEFYVKDTGLGISDNNKDLIFERFRKGNESHYRDFEGSGLGLSICRSYVEMLGGRIWAESEEGKGSTFYFTIPYNPVLEEVTTLKDDVSDELKDGRIRKLKILIVEDDEISYSLLTRIVQKISKEVLHAVTGVEAVETCRNNPDLDLVLMDIRMPMMSGLEATQQIRLFNKDVIIIAQTAYGFTSDFEKALEAGCNDYIKKPIEKALLYDLIKKHCYL